MYVDVLLQKGGFFVEAGAQDGERASNSVWLEASHGWTGLLVEIDPWFYTQMRAKLRRAHTINAGLSSKPYITQVRRTGVVNEIAHCSTEPGTFRSHNCHIAEQSDSNKN